MLWDEGLVNSLVYDTPSPTEGRVIAYPKAANEAPDLALGRDARVFVLGQGQAADLHRTGLADIFLVQGAAQEGEVTGADG